MKTPTLSLVFALAAILGCASPHQNAQQARPPDKPRMTEAEVIAVAQRLVPLMENESYRAVYLLDEGVWRVVDQPHRGFTRRTFTMLLIRDEDGTVLGIASY